MSFKIGVFTNEGRKLERGGKSEFIKWNKKKGEVVRKEPKKRSQRNKESKNKKNEVERGRK